MQDGTMRGYANIAGDKAGPVTHAVELQFTYSYGPGQAAKEHEVVNGTFADRCGKNSPQPNCLPALQVTTNNASNT